MLFHDAEFVNLAILQPFHGRFGTIFRQFLDILRPFVVISVWNLLATRVVDPFTLYRMTIIGPKKGLFGVSGQDYFKQNFHYCLFSPPVRFWR